MTGVGSPEGFQIRLIADMRLLSADYLAPKVMAIVMKLFTTTFCGIEDDYVDQRLRPVFFVVHVRVLVLAF
jgi:hypothetical protein